VQYTEAVYNLKFDEEPDYKYLKFLFQRNLMDKDMIPDWKFDWVDKKSKA